MNTRVMVLLVAFGCGGTVDPGSPPTLPQDSPEAPAVAFGPAAQPDAACWQCVAAGWVDTCTQTLSADAVSCLMCGTWCDSGAR